MITNKNNSKPNIKFKDIKQGKKIKLFLDVDDKFKKLIISINNQGRNKKIKPKNNLINVVNM